MQIIYLSYNYEWRERTAGSVQFKSYLAWRIEQGAPIKSIKGEYSDKAKYILAQEWGKALESEYGVQVDLVLDRFVVNQAYARTLRSYSVDTPWCA